MSGSKESGDKYTEKGTRITAFYKLTIKLAECRDKKKLRADWP